MAYCPKCGSSVSGTVCHYCGTNILTGQPQYQQQYQQPQYQQRGGPYPPQPQKSGPGKMIIVIVIVVVAIIAIAALALLLGGGGTGTCVIRWGGGTPTQYLPNYTESECDAKCEELQNELDCYWTD